MKTEEKDDRCWVCLRITPAKTLKLAHQIWDEDQAAAREIGLEASEIIEQAYRKNPIFFCGRTATRILSGLFYLLGLRHKSKKTQRAVWFTLTGKHPANYSTLNASYRSWVTKFPELFSDFEFDSTGKLTQNWRVKR